MIEVLGFPIYNPNFGLVVLLVVGAFVTGLLAGLLLASMAGKRAAR
jgi:hypothetical protein